MKQLFDQNRSPHLERGIKPLDADGIGTYISEIDFVNFDVETNEELLVQVITELSRTASVEIRLALRNYGSQPTDVITDSIRLLHGYQYVWRKGRRKGAFFEASCVGNPLQALLKSRDALKDAACDSPLCKTALKVLEDYETYRWRRAAVSKHIRVQRRLLAKDYELYFNLLAIMEGRQCYKCKSKPRRLNIDHMKPLSKGGLTEINNLQLLCCVCNRKKGTKSE